MTMAIKERMNHSNLDYSDTQPLVRDEEYPEDFDDASNIENHRHSVSKSQMTESIVIGSLNIIDSKFESLDYETCENSLEINEQTSKGYKLVVKKSLARWFIFLAIGVLTAFVGIFIDISIEELSNLKYSIIKRYMDDCSANSCLYIPFFIWTGINVITVIIGSLLVTYVEPIALGSGIPQVKCYLNGVKMPRIVRIKTLIVKTIGVISSVVGGLAGGKEGPMIHSGAVVAAGISQGKSTTLKRDFGVFSYFREDHEKRDFVSGGAAAGVAAAFGAPVGGVLFSLEEGASFWNQSLTWRIFFASIVSTFTLNIVLSAYHGHPGELTYSGLLNFGKFDSLNYELFELVLFVLMGAIGGLLGSLFNYCNYKLTVFRMRYIRAKWMKVTEAVTVAAFSASIAMLMIYYLDECNPLGQDPTKYPLQMYCADGEYNTISALWMQVPEASVRSLFHDPEGSQNMQTLFLFVLVYYLLSIWTYGLSVSAGLFIPCLLTGAAWGRLFGIGLETLFPDAAWVTPGKYALVGAAAHLGGVVRMTISLTVIMIEATGNISFGLPLMVTLITAKWVGDFFNEGLYDIHIQLSGVPLLAWEPPPLSSNVRAHAFMSYPVYTLKPIETVGHIVDLLKNTTFNGFPVTDTEHKIEPKNGNAVRGQSFGRLRGLILRSQLIVLLQNLSMFEGDVLSSDLTPHLFRNEYPRYPTIEEVHVPAEKSGCRIDLRPFMSQSPYTVSLVASLPRIFRLFRALGLRHLIVVNDYNEVVGMVTRKDLARYRVWKHRGHMGVEELRVLEKVQC
ncbi:H(+)/Cl(-) exchange transporter 7 [Nilaparvata lugens]|uniref:H(+)/Cl(-) exchange transporter 7 n=1 Tax=Nilaparvata lugens TaxID=108931 RepID=UPI00193E8737|nr:H(+)/Cl(-) exchange transporter 7 [Nilaparvata lugens]XP_039293987.1 H(+)/Cl(-) exchange transporter 7 [Nilaparvata lugens]XP_039293988.1 H(+)/Cl(-) exchange transporter 7 [Nilaparvata lugens]